LKSHIAEIARKETNELADKEEKAGKNRITHSLVYFFASLGVVVFVVTITPLVSWWGGKLAGPWEDPKGDVLIVLGGSASNSGIIGESSYLRAEYAILAYKEGGFRTIVLSGGGSPTPVAAAMQDFIACQGVPKEVIVAETTSISTRENAIYTQRLLSDARGKKVLMTSDFHMFRAYRVFRKVGLDVLPRPIPDVRKRGARWRGRWPAFVDLVEEAAKIVYYFVRGWI
jgi:uncharacterized SAM-binding protein YcdF (DUF218 family)